MDQDLAVASGTAISVHNERDLLFPVHQSPPMTFAIRFMGLALHLLPPIVKGGYYFRCGAGLVTSL